MRILYFTRDYTPHDFRFLNSLAENGYEVFYLRLERSGRELEKRPLPSSVKTVSWRGGQRPFQWRDLPAFLKDLQRVIHEVQPDILHAGPIQDCAFLGVLSGFRPLVSMSWGSDLLKDADRNFALRKITQYTLARSTVLAGDCQAVRDKAASFGFPAERTFMFPWGIDLERFKPRDNDQPPSDLRMHLGWQNRFVILSLRSWEPVYGVDVMLRGFARAAKEEPNLRLLMLGSGSLAPLVHQIIEENDLQDRVHLGGQVAQAELPEIYRTADLYLSASHSDGSSVSLMEALGSGLPVLVTDIPSNREWVTGGREGLLFPDHDDQAVGAGILRVYREPEARMAMHEAARQRAEDRADWNKNFQVLEEAYRQALHLVRSGALA